MKAEPHDSEAVDIEGNTYIRPGVPYVTRRWQMKRKVQDQTLSKLDNAYQAQGIPVNHERVFIMYGEEDEVRMRAESNGYYEVEPSGHYCYETNTIVNGKDGPSYFDDRRLSGRLYSQ